MIKTKHKQTRQTGSASRRRSATMSNEDNGNLCAGAGVGASNVAAGLLKPNSSSNEDLSEYTDADESISAPTEVLAEFLSAVMLKDYETALKYCKLILQYEPNNVTAKDFYPLILDKIQKPYNKQSPSQSDADSNSISASESEENDSSSSSSSDSSSEEDEAEDEEDEEISVDGEQEDKRHSSDGDATTASYSSLEDEEAEADQLSALAAKYKVDNVDLGNGNKIICNSTNKWNTKSDYNNSTSGSAITAGVRSFGTSSDSESPTEPISQQTIAMLRAKVVPSKH